MRSAFKMHFETHEGLVPKDTLFIHGNMASSRWWRPVLRVLQERPGAGKAPGALIFADWRGSGRSPDPDSASDMDMERLARDYVDLLTDIGRRHVNVVGHSTGGLIALLAMRRSPETFHRAVLLDSVGAKGIALGSGMREAFHRMAGDKPFAAQVIASTLHGPAALRPFVTVELAEDAFRAARSLKTWVLDALERVDYEGDIRAVSQPTLVLHGEHDAVLPMEGSRRLAALPPGGSFKELKGRGHCANVEDPEGFIGLVEDFLFR
ncbi:MAG: alpha/beta hydrolase [Elusimicrobiota bacterium]